MKTLKLQVTFTVEVEAKKVSKMLAMADQQVEAIVEEIFDTGQAAMESAGRQTVYDSYTFEVAFLEEGDSDGN